MKRILALAVLLTMLLSACAAQADVSDLYIDKNVQSIFTSEDGLLSTSTQAVTQTRDGFIWIGGYGGLVRYDGRSFRTFAYKRITRVSDLAADPDGALWVATSDKGLFRYADNAFTNISGEGEDAVLDVTCMSFAPDGTLYLGTGSGLCAVEDRAMRRLDIPELDGAYIDFIRCCSDGRVFCVTRSGELYAFDGEGARRVAGESDCVIRSICRNDQDGTYRAGTSGRELLVLDGDLNVVETLKLASLSCVNDLQYDDKGTLCLCADNGIAIYVEDSLRTQNLLMNNSVDRMLIDMEGDYWFVSSRQGVLEVSRSQFGDIKRSAGLDDVVVNAIQRIDDTLFIGHDSGLVTLSVSDLKKFISLPLSEVNDTRVRALLADSRKDLWIGTMKKGLMRYTKEGRLQSFTTETAPALRSDNVRVITETDNGVLIGTDVGAYLVEDGEVRSVADDPKALGFRILSAVKYGDTCCLGSDGNGLYLVRDGEIARHITTEDGLSSNVIMKEYRSDAFGGLWLVTGNNLDFLSDDGSITSIANFPSTNNLDLVLMENGDAWVLTGSGIYRTTEDSLLHDAEPRYVSFRHADGMPYEVTPNSYQCLTDGTLYVCGSGGVFSLQTDFAQAEAANYPLVVDSVMADGNPIYIRPGEPCEIDAAVKRVDINAYALTYRAENPQVFYRLEGFDDQDTVVRLRELSGITYTNLNGGSYTFRFGVMDHRTGEVLREIALPIVKRHPWYQLPAVKLAGVVLGLAALMLATVLIVRRRSRRIERTLQAEYERKERHHLKKIAYEDYLTGLYNRNYLDVWNSRQPDAGDYPISFVSIDMNDLKRVNDRHGHKNGDQLLCEMADLLKRHFDGEAFAVLRIGGDEFLILARGVDGDAMRARLEAMAEEGRGISVNGIPVTFAYGICTQREGEFSFDEGLRRSDLEMLEDKNRFHGRQ